MRAFHAILVAVDGSEPGQHAADFAIRVADGSRLIFVSVVDSARIAARAMHTPFATPQPIIEETTAEARRIVTACTEKAQSAHAHARGLVVEGEPVDAILQTAEELHADLIVLATRGRSGLARAVMGSVAEGIARRATIPVMFAPSAAEPQRPERHLHQIVQEL